MDVLDATQHLPRSIPMCPLDTELTIQQAADILHVSPPFVIQLIGEGQLLAMIVGAQPSILRSDILDFKRRNDDARLLVLEELTREAQELGLGY